MSSKIETKLPMHLLREYWGGAERIVTMVDSFCPKAGGDEK